MLLDHFAENALQGGGLVGSTLGATLPRSAHGQLVLV